MQSANTGLGVNEGASALISDTELLATDADHPAGQLTYTVGTAPAHGVLSRNGVALGAGGAFTQGDVDSGLVSYTHDGSETTADSFTFTLRDAAGAALPMQSFLITVNPVNDPVALTGAALAIAGNGGTTIRASAFTTVDPDGPTLTYTVQNVTDGYFERVSAPGTPITTFSAAELAAGQVRFVQTGGAAAPGFEVSASDGMVATPFISASISFAPTAVEPSNPGIVVDFSPPPPVVIDTPVVSGGGQPPTTTTPAADDKPLQEAAARPTLLTLSVPRKPPAPRPAPKSGAAGESSVAVAENDDRGIVETTKPGAAAFTLPAVTLPPTTVPGTSGLTDPDLLLAARAKVIAELAGVLDDEPEPTRLELAMKSAQVASLALSVGVVTWILRAGGLVSSLLASLPAWRHMDPLPILARDDEDDEEAANAGKMQRKDLAEEQDEKKVDRVLAQV
jgi:hypothetical protein